MNSKPILSLLFIVMVGCSYAHPPASCNDIALASECGPLPGSASLYWDDDSPSAAADSTYLVRLDADPGWILTGAVIHQVARDGSDLYIDHQSVWPTHDAAPTDFESWMECQARAGYSVPLISEIRVTADESFGFVAAASVRELDGSDRALVRNTDLLAAPGASCEAVGPASIRLLRLDGFACDEVEAVRIDWVIREDDWSGHRCFYWVGEIPPMSG